MRVALSLLLLITLTALSGCETTRVGGVVVTSAPPDNNPPVKHEPPPQAPAYGQRAKQDSLPPPAQKSAKKSPPAHAPAYGKRYKHDDGMEFVYDDNLGVYVMVNVKDTYLHNNLYLRFYNNNWQVSVRFDGPWQAAKNSQIPPKLKSAKNNASAKANRGNNKQR